MKLMRVMITVLIAGCSGGNGSSASQGAAAAWPTKWCQAQPGITKEQLVGIMGPPTTSFPDAMSWADRHHYQFNAFLNEDGTVRQLDINQASLTDAEKAALQCEDVRTKRSMAVQAKSPPSDNRPACEIVTQAQMSAIIGSPLVAESSGRSKCIYKTAGARSPYVEFSFDPGDGAAAMAGGGFAENHQPGLTNPYEGLGDQAFSAGPALFIKTGDDLVTLVFNGVEDAPTVAKKVLEIAKPAH